MKRMFKSLFGMITALLTLALYMFVRRRGAINERQKEQDLKRGTERSLKRADIHAKQADKHMQRAKKLAEEAEQNVEAIRTDNTSTADRVERWNKRLRVRS